MLIGRDAFGTRPYRFMKTVDAAFGFDRSDVSFACIDNVKAMGIIGSKL